MALVACKECNETVSTEAAACPHCGAPQQPPAPPVLPVQPKEETIYSDNTVVVTNMRVIIGGATYALRNITSVKMLFTPPRLVKPILLLIVGLMILLAAFFPINENAPAPASAYVIAGMMIVGAILWMVSAKTKFPCRPFERIRRNQMRSLPRIKPTLSNRIEHQRSHREASLNLN